ncbi:hypothetical protein BKA69DRAFT_1048338, partial [Paraphysoderma sedebokerense]
MLTSDIPQTEEKPVAPSPLKKLSKPIDTTPAAETEHLEPASETKPVESAESVPDQVETASDAKMEETPVDPLVKAQEFYDEGLKLYGLKKFDLSAAKLSQAIELFVNVYGSLHPKCAEPFYQYGCALLQTAIEKSGILGDSEQVKNATGKREVDLLSTIDSAVTSDMAPTKDSSRFVFEGDAPEEEEAAEGEEEEAEDVEEDDFEIAFENLEMAKTIYMKMLDGEIDANGEATVDGKGKEKVSVDENLAAELKKKLAEVYMTLGDVNLESESFDASVDDYESALKLKQSWLQEDDRQLAECYYKLGLAYEYSDKSLEKAVEHMELAKKTLSVKKTKLEARIAEQKESSDPEDIKELSEVNELFPDLNLKVYLTLPWHHRMTSLLTDV